MKIIINTASSHKGGGVQVCLSFIEECRKFPENEYHVVLGVLLSRMIDKQVFGENFFFYEIGFRPATRVFSFRSHNGYLKKIEKMVKPDAVFSVGGPAYWRPEVFHLMGYTLPHYIYPDSPFFRRIPINKRLKWLLKSIVVKYFIKHDADAYIVQTEDVNDRLRKWIGSNEVHTITNTVGSQYYNFKKNNIHSAPIKANHFRFIMLSAYYRHKNFEVINDVCRILSKKNRRDIKFILTLPDEDYNALFDAETKKYIENIGPVKPIECPALYGEADFVFLPTLLECFSATYVEGFIMGKPVLTSDLPFAKTVCEEAAVYFDPLDANDIVDKMIGLINSTETQNQLREYGKLQVSKFLSAEQRAEKILNLINKYISR